MAVAHIEIDGGRPDPHADAGIGERSPSEQPRRRAASGRGGDIDGVAATHRVGVGAGELHRSRGGAAAAEELRDLGRIGARCRHECGTIEGVRAVASELDANARWGRPGVQWSGNRLAHLIREAADGAVGGQRTRCAVGDVVAGLHLDLGEQNVGSADEGSDVVGNGVVVAPDLHGDRCGRHRLGGEADTGHQVVKRVAGRFDAVGARPGTDGDLCVLGRRRLDEPAEAAAEHAGVDGEATVLAGGGRGELHAPGVVADTNGCCADSRSGSRDGGGDTGKTAVAGGHDLHSTFAETQAARERDVEVLDTHAGVGVERCRSTGLDRAECGLDTVRGHLAVGADLGAEVDDGERAERVAAGDLQGGGRTFASSGDGERAARIERSDGAGAHQRGVHGGGETSSVVGACGDDHDARGSVDVEIDGVVRAVDQRAPTEWGGADRGGSSRRLGHLQVDFADAEAGAGAHGADAELADTGRNRDGRCEGHR